MRLFKNILFACIVIMLSLPLIQSRTGFIREKGLVGFFRLQEKPSVWNFTPKRWFNGSFQDEYSHRIEDHTGFRNTGIRIRNQYDYSLFGISHASGFIREKEGMLIEEDYIGEYTGKYFIGKSTINQKLDRLKNVIENLRKNNTDLILVIEPGKASFYPEFIPDHYRPEKRTISNYDFLVEGLEKRNIPFLDLNSLFVSMKDTSRYPLFPKYGMHWSMYGMWHVIDTLTKYIGKVHRTTLPSVKFDGIELSDKPRGTDFDIGVLLNLIFPLPATTLAYPVVTVSESGVERKLSALVVADSYWVNIEQEAASKLFGKDEFWYYNSKVYPYVIDDQNPVYIDKSDLKKKLEEFDVILLMSSEINLHCMFWNFIDEAYQAFNPWEKEDPVYAYENKIKNHRDWFRYVAGKAQSKQRTVERMIRMDAEYMYNLENKKQ